MDRDAEWEPRVRSIGAHSPRVPQVALSLHDRYLAFLAIVLAGYALLGKGFAYLGFPPLFVGEIALLSGLVIFLRTGCLIASLATLPSFLLVAMMAWVLLRTVPYVGTFGIDALRDSVVVMYGGFAFIIIALVLEDNSRLETILRYYSSFVGFFIPAIPFVYAISHFMRDSSPQWPGNPFPIFSVQNGEAAVHLAGATVFALAGFRKVPRYWILFVVATLALVIPASRGAMLAFVVPVALAALLLGKMREIMVVLVIGSVLFGALYAGEMAFTERREAYSSEERLISTRQVVDNVTSIFGWGNEQTEGTKQWRLDWWNMIIKDTLFGPNFWTGRGFGLNLAEADGFRPDKNAIFPLRSPHNVHITMLARAGVSGMVLWELLLASWFSLLATTTLRALRREQRAWAGLFVFVGCYAMAAVINGSFDPALEGPMQGIWFWCVFGLGVGSLMVYRAQCGMMRARAHSHGVNGPTSSVQEDVRPCP